ncbi:hypothetical protein ACP275_14G123300 [Erythranthe tilingii]
MPPLTCCVDAAAAASDSAAAWSPADSSRLYRVDGWGAPYFTVNSNGNISVRPHGAQTLAHQEIDLLKVVRKASGPKTTDGLPLRLPLVVRFPDVLKNRLESLQSSFDSAIESQKYKSHYQGVYPVKCNQDKFVVEDIVKFGSGFKFGLEAGSKPELLLAMSSLCNGSPDALLVCNGFKDVEFVSLALVAKKLDLNTVIVLEQEEELDIVIEVSKKLGVRPVIGARAKLRTKHSGHFGSTSGEKGKFGLTTLQLLRVVKKLRDYEMLDCLWMLHFHIGSQIPSTDLLADAVDEAAQIYCELVRLGAHMGVIDVGGGLGIDYDGSKSSDSKNSVAYTLQDYASAVVRSVRIVCDSKSVKHPIICSESGRAIVSHHSILVFEAVSNSTSSCNSPEISSLDFEEQLKDDDDALANYRNLSAAAAKNDYESCLNYAEQLKERCVEQFKKGSLGMEELAAVDARCELMFKEIGFPEPVSTYHVNLSIFTSIPDFWGIGQLFPIIPIHRLTESPKKEAILSDLTCDSDGKIDKFIGGKSSLRLHELGGGKGNGGYYLGMFLGGAYEEALGGVHNLFGRPSVVRVSQSDGPQSFAVMDDAVPGASCGDVLRAMNHVPEDMLKTLKARLDEFVVISSGEVIVNELASSFDNMPYLVVDNAASSSSSSSCNGNNNNNG